MIREEVLYSIKTTHRDLISERLSTKTLENPHTKQSAETAYKSSSH